MNQEKTAEFITWQAFEDAAKALSLIDSEDIRATKNFFSEGRLKAGQAVRLSEESLYWLRRINTDGRNMLYHLTTSHLLKKEFERRAKMTACADFQAENAPLFAALALPEPIDLGAVFSRSTYKQFGLTVTGHAKGWQIKVGERIISQGKAEKIQAQEAALLEILMAARTDYMLDDDALRARQKAYGRPEPLTLEAIQNALAVKPKALPKPKKIADSGHRGPNVMSLIAKRSLA